MKIIRSLLDTVFPRAHHGHGQGGHKHDRDHSRYKTFLRGRAKLAENGPEALKEEKHHGHQARENAASEKEAPPKEEDGQ